MCFTPYNDYDYDDLDRLTEADYLVGVLTEDEQFTYDDLGNRTNVNLRSGDNESYSVNNLTNRYNSVGGNSLDYDDAGNLTQDPNGYEYEYDYENRLIEITKGQTSIAQYEYDALGRRIEKIDSIANETTRYYYDNEWRLLAEFDDNDTQLRDFIYGNFIDEVLVMTDSDEDMYYYAHNHIYSVVALIDDNGNVVERYEYNAYGLPTIYNSDFSQTYDTSQYSNPYFLTGRNMDSLDVDVLQLGFNRNRYYDYYTGRWLSHDKQGYVDGLNLYDYNTSDPISFLDPLGWWKIHRNKRSRASVVSEKGDTLMGLAKKIRLEPTEFPLWLRGRIRFQLNETDSVEWNAENTNKYFDVNKWMLNRKICPGLVFTIPNKVIVIYGYDASKRHWGANTFNLVRTHLKLTELIYEHSGFEVVPVKYPPSSQPLKKWFADIDLHGLVFGGHGENGTIVARSDWEQYKEYDEEIGREVWKTKGYTIILQPDKHVHHRLALLELIACGTAMAYHDQNIFDPISVGGRKDVSKWELNVSSLGYFRGIKYEGLSFINMKDALVEVKGGAEIK